VPVSGPKAIRPGLAEGPPARQAGAAGGRGRRRGKRVRPGMSHLTPKATN